MTDTARAGRRVLYSGFHYLHHNPGSGYDAVVSDPRDYVSGARLPFADRLESTKPRHLNFLLLDLITVLRGLRYDTVHYFYPESTAYLSPWILRFLGKRIVYTVHLDDSQWFGDTRSVHHRIKQKSMRAAHAIVVLSAQQRDVFQAALPDKMVSFIPHGFEFDDETEPALQLFEARTRGLRRLVLVGSNYRDFDMLEQILAQRGSRPVQIDLVGMDEATRSRFTGRDGVVCHPRLDADSYVRLLRESFALLLPLTFATANNALFEAYNCYLPAFVSRIDGVTDYAADGDRSLFSSPEEFWSKYDALAALNASELRQHCMALNSAARDRFSWDKVRTELAGVYGARPLINGSELPLAHVGKDLQELPQFTSEDRDEQK